MYIFSLHKKWHSFFLIQEDHVQILNVGAGLDTTFFWLMEKYKKIKYFELDFYELLYEKTKIISNVDPLKKFLIYDEKDVTKKENPDLIYCYNYKMIYSDLNDWEAVETSLKNASFDFNKPTLFLCECVLVYLEVESSDRILKKLSELMTNTCCLILYEQTNPNTAFGRVMTSCFARKNIPLKSIKKYNSLQSQCERFKSLGWKNVYAYDMNEVYDYHLDAEEKKRIEKIELFDELEEWRLFQNHYFMLIAYNCYNDLNLNFLENFLNVNRKKSK